MDFKYLSEEESKLVVLVCRLCINVTETSYPISYLNILVSDVLPDLDLSLSKDPVACMNCLKALSASFNFKKMCMQTEQIIRDNYEKTNNPVNLYTLIETRQEYDAMSNIPQNNFKYRCKPTMEIPIKNPPICNRKTPQTCDDTLDIVESTNYVIGIEKAEQKILLENEHIKAISDSKLEITERIPKSNNYSEKLSCLEENKNHVRIKETLTADFEVPDDDMPEVIEIVESDVNSDVELDCPDKEFKEFCCKGTGDNGSYDEGYDNKEELKNVATIKDENCIQIVDHHIESDDSDMIFTEEFSEDSFNKIYRKNIDSKPATSAIVRVPQKENTSSSPNTILQSDNILSMLSGKGSRKLKKKKNLVKLHKRINTALFICVVCNKPFTQKLHVDGHLLTKHKDIPDIEKKVDSKIHYCHYCSYRTVNNYNLSTHLASKHNLKTSLYQSRFRKLFCAHCEYSTINRGNLIIHIRSHNLVKAFQCQLCKKAYNQKVLLDRHIIKNHTAIFTQGVLI